MKKLLLSLFAVLAAFAVKAETVVTFDFDKNATELFGIEGRSSSSSNAGDITENVTATVDGVSMTVTPSGESTANRLWVSSPVLRMYGGTFTVSAPDHKISKIEFVYGKISITPSNGTLDKETWTGDASEVVFTVSANTQLKSMTVTLDGEAGEEPDPDPVVIDGTGEGTLDSPYDVERAISLITNDQIPSDKVYVKGTISSVTEISETYGNATYILTQNGKDLTVYRGKYYKGENFPADGIKAGDEVVVLGKLKDYNGTPEVDTNNELISINGVGAPEEPVYEPEGDGSKENPYTVADVMNLPSDGGKYWVVGYILGSATSATKLNDADKAVDTNIALGETADATKFIPVELPNSSGLRTILGVKTNPGNVGKQVKVYGTLAQYFSTAGVKGVTEYAWVDGSTGIDTVEAVSADAVYYNLQGIRVANPENGIFIRVQGNSVSKVLVK